MYNTLDFRITMIKSFIYMLHQGFRDGSVDKELATQVWRLRFRLSEFM